MKTANRAPFRCTGQVYESDAGSEAVRGEEAKGKLLNRALFMELIVRLAIVKYCHPQGGGGHSMVASAVNALCSNLKGELSRVSAHMLRGLGGLGFRVF
jgi:hypothetical protein